MDFSMMDFSNEWSVPTDDFLESIFSSDLLKELEGPDLNITEFPDETNLNHDKLSTISSTNDKNFNGFQEMDFNDINLTFPENQPLISSNSSDSGLSSDHLDIDTSPDYEPLSPALSSPGPSISERGGQNSPPRYINQIIHPNNIKIETLEQPKVIVEKVNSGDGNLLFNNELGTSGQILPKEVKIYRMPQQNHNNSIESNGIGKKVTIQLKNSTKSHNKNAVIINKQGIPVSGNIAGVKKLIRVQNPSNPRSILLPVSIQDVKDFRTIKIISASNMKSKSSNIKLAAANLLQQTKQGLVQKNIAVSKDQLISTDDSFSDHTSDGESFVFEEVMQQTSTVIEAVERKKQQTPPLDEYDDNEIDDDQDDDASIIDDDNMTTTSTATTTAQITSKMNSSANIGYPKLILTAEEKRLLAKEGITLPSNYPLTKHEERELKRIRRKIRNKISAQDSRKRKKEYVDGLEERVKQCTEENQTLLKRIKLLQTQNHNLMSQMKKLQSLLTKGTNKTAQPATCLMVLLLSMVLVAVPNIKIGQNAKEADLVDAIQNSLSMPQQKTRSLLFDSKDQLGDALTDEELNFDELMQFTGLNENDYNEEAVESSSSAALGGSTSSQQFLPPVPNKKLKTLIDFDVDDHIWSSSSKSSTNDNKVFNDQAKIYQENQKLLQSSGFNIENDSHKIDPDLMDLINKNSDGSFELNIDKIATLSKQAADLNRILITNENEIIVDNNHHHNHQHHNGILNNKKNSSAQIKTRNLIVQDV